MSIPILTYHAMNIDGPTADRNDLVGLSEDIEVLHGLGYRIRPLADIVRRWLHAPSSVEGCKEVALTCDDGSDFDFHDLPHPTWGVQRSILNRLADAAAKLGIETHATSFVIASPEARRELDRSCMIGRGWWTDAWWGAAIASGHLHVASHSWDHNHDALPDALRHGVEPGTFASIATYALAEMEIGRAAEFLAQRAPNPGQALFAYPYGAANDYLADEYLPRFAARHGLIAAFTTEPVPLRAHSHRWKLPRFVRGTDWSSAPELRSLLAKCE